MHVFPVWPCPPQCFWVNIPICVDTGSGAWAQTQSLPGWGLCFSPVLHLKPGGLPPGVMDQIQIGAQGEHCSVCHPWYLHPSLPPSVTFPSPALSLAYLWVLSNATQFQSSLPPWAVTRDLQHYNRWGGAGRHIRTLLDTGRILGRPQAVAGLRRMRPETQFARQQWWC